ncbi:ImmA/IrrE family metallo-endopeptidase [Henriciella mobilis]|nr:ImmA/IrrE family metallo-endopeptidase [Henriciella mobilis]
MKTAKRTMLTFNRIRPWSPEWNRLGEATQEVLLGFLQEAPVKISRICNALSIKVVAAPLPARISGEIRYNPEDESFKIKVNRYESSNRQRFSAAHELAHYLLHRDLIIKEGSIVDNVLFRSNVSNMVEAQANRLAADLLMPIHLLREYINAHEANQNDDTFIVEMAQDFGVSEMALRFRLGI